MKDTYFPVVILAFSTAFASGALAQERSVSGLPGVEPQKPLVAAPPPAPEPDHTPKGSWKNFRVGNTDVSISGDIIIDVGTGKGGSRRR